MPAGEGSQKMDTFTAAAPGWRAALEALAVDGRGRAGPSPRAHASKICSAAFDIQRLEDVMIHGVTRGARSSPNMKSASAGKRPKVVGIL
jgi:hypothetical protein